MKQVIVIPIKCSVMRKFARNIENILLLGIMAYSALSMIWLIGFVIGIFTLNTGSVIRDFCVLSAAAMGTFLFTVICSSIIMDGLKWLWNNIPTFKCIEDEKKDTE